MSRRGVLALLGGWALAMVARPVAALAQPRSDLVLRDGWILHPNDLSRLGLE